MRPVRVLLLVTALVVLSSCRPTSHDFFIPPDFVYVFAEEGSTRAFIQHPGLPGGEASLEPAPGSPTSVGLAPLALAADLSLVYVIGADHNVYAFMTSLEQHTLGKLLPVSLGFPLHVPGTPQALAAGGGLLYVATAEGEIYGYRVNSVTAPVLVSAVHAGVDPRALAFTIPAYAASPALYVANHGSDNVSAFNVNGITGELTEISGSPFPAAAGPISVQATGITPKFLYVANELSNDVSAYQIVPGGGLSPVAGSFSTGVRPVSLAVERHLSPRPYVFVANAESNTLSVFKIDEATGSLSNLATIPVGTRPVSVEAFTQVMVASADSRNMFTFNVGQDGSLTPSGPAVVLDKAPVAVLGVQTPK